MGCLLVASLVVVLSAEGGPQEAQVLAPLKAQVPALPTPAIEVGGPGVTQQLELTDGTQAIGRVEAITAGHLTFRTTAGVVMEVEIAAVRSVRAITGSVVNGEFWPADSNPTRLFFAPTGRSLKKGEAYFGVYEIMLPFVQYGVTDRLSIGGGTPFVFGTGGGQPFWFTPKYQIVRARSTEAAVGVLHFVNMGDASVGIAYAVVTQGNNDNALTIGGGYAYASGADHHAGAPVVMLGGEKRLSKRLKIVTENYWFEGNGLASVGWRFMGERLSADIGLVAPLGGDVTFVFPMINFVWKIR